MNLLAHLQLEPPPVYFMHLEKTAGSSLRRLLKMLYPSGQVLSVWTPRDLTHASYAELPHFRCYLCHLGAGFYDLVGRTDLACVTLLREPVERTISHIYMRQRYFTEKSLRYHPDQRERLARLSTGDLRTCLDDALIVHNLENFQCRQLGIAYDYRSYFSGGNSVDIFWPFNVTALTESHDIKQIAAQARQRLDGMAVVGITERFDESIAMLCDLVGVPPPAHPPRANIATQKAAVSIRSYRAKLEPDLVEQIEEMTRYDHELYTYAYELFEQQLASYRAKPRHTYSVAPRIRMLIRATARPVWQQVKQIQPRLTNAPSFSWVRSLTRRLI
jgi:hypothetical protein